MQKADKYSRRPGLIKIPLEMNERERVSLSCDSMLYHILLKSKVLYNFSGVTKMPDFGRKQDSVDKIFVNYAQNRRKLREIFVLRKSEWQLRCEATTTTTTTTVVMDDRNITLHAVPNEAMLSYCGSWMWAFKRDTGTMNKTKWNEERKKEEEEEGNYTTSPPHTNTRHVQYLLVCLCFSLSSARTHTHTFRQTHRPPYHARLVVMSDIYFTFISIILNRKSQLWFISWVLRKITCD